MAKKVNGIGQYSVKETGQVVEYPFEFLEFSSLDDAQTTLGEADCLSLIQRQTKVDANNVAREKAKTQNGHSSRKPLTEAEKAQAKAERATNKKLLEALKAKGIVSLDDLSGLL